MDNIKAAVEKRGTTLQEVESPGMFLDRKSWRDFFADRPEAY